MELALMIEQCREEVRAMLMCANLNPRETGNSIYMQLAIAAERRMVEFERVRSALSSRERRLTDHD